MQLILKNFYIILCSLITWPLLSQDLTLVPFAQGLNQPVTLAHAGDDRLFVLEKRGRINIIQPDGQVNSELFLDIRTRVSVEENEMGLLGLAFHPQYADNGFFYVNFTDADFKTNISRFSVDSNDPNRADPNSEKVLLTIQQPYGNHNGGDMHFGPDGYLYIGMGDGGNGGDPGNRAQNLANLLGKMLRIDIDNGDPYGIPTDNPFVGNTIARDEIWAYGLRNPWRFSFDRQTGDMFIGDVGQNEYEEIDFQPANSPGGENYGWRCYEANNAFNLSQCAGITGLTWPVTNYFHTFLNGCSITGGYMYRGSNSAYVGKYLFGDYCSGRFWTLERDGNDGWTRNIVGNMDQGELVAFGEDNQGELYVVAIGAGRIYKVQFPIVDGIGKVSNDPLQLWPNPFVDAIQVSGAIDAPVEFNVLDAKGVLQKTIKIQSAQEGTELNLSDLGAGVYFISYVINGQSFVEKVLHLSN